MYIDYFSFGYVKTKPPTVDCVFSEIGPQRMIHLHFTGLIAVIDGMVPWLSNPGPADHFTVDVATSQEGLLERNPEFPVEVSVDEGVQSWIEIAHPEHQCDYPRGAVAQLRAAHCSYHVPGKKTRVNELFEAFATIVQCNLFCRDLMT